MSGFGATSAFDLVLLEVVQLGDAGLVEGEFFYFDRFHRFVVVLMICCFGIDLNGLFFKAGTLTAVEPGSAVFAHVTVGLSGFGAASAFDLVLLEVVQLGDAGLVEGELLGFDRFHN